MLDKVSCYVQKNNMLKAEDSVIVGVSGGADSVCLLLVLDEISKRTGFKITAVHVNHNIRGLDAIKDQEFVENLCKRLNITCKVENIYPLEMAKEKGYSTEEAGRIGRYTCFKKIMEELSATKIAVAHNKDDNAETVLLNLFRGTGIKGLCGILPVRDEVIRPLLCVSRAEIEEYLKECNQKFCTDATNLSDDYTRNKVRHNILPYAGEFINNKSLDNVTLAAENLVEIERFLSAITDKLFLKAVKIISDEELFIENKISDEDVVIRKRLIRKALGYVAGSLKDITKEHVNMVLGLFDNDVSKMVNLPYDIAAVRTYEGVTICRESKQKKEEESLFVEIDMNRDMVYETAKGRFKITIEDNYKNNEEIEDILYTKVFDYDTIKGNLVIRNKQIGDYIEIANGQNKKLKSYFIDCKIPQQQRKDKILIADGNHILWIVGHRISNAYKVSGKTKKILKISYIGENYGR